MENHPLTLRNTAYVYRYLFIRKHIVISLYILLLSSSTIHAEASKNKFRTLNPFIIQTSTFREDKIPY